MPRSKEAIDRAKTKYRRKNAYPVGLFLHKVNDADILDKLDSVENKSGYIKGLLREQIRREERTRNAEE